MEIGLENRQRSPKHLSGTSRGEQEPLRLLKLLQKPKVARPGDAVGITKRRGCLQYSEPWWATLAADAQDKHSDEVDGIND